MDFFSKYFKGKQAKTLEVENFEEGDILYVEKEGIYELFKILKIDKILNVLHLMAFETVSKIPELKKISDLAIRIYHFPIAINGLKEPKRIGNIGLSMDDLLGYFEYIKQTQNKEEIVIYAHQFFRNAYTLSNERKHKEAINAYAKAIDLQPNYVEAIENRAFCFMDLEQWEEAIDGFHQSLKVHPNSLIATFSIGECYMALKQYEKAKEYLEKAIQIHPSETKPKEFLAIVDTILKNETQV